MEKDEVYKTNALYWSTRGNEILSAIVLPEYGLFVSEEKHQLFGDISGKKLLEIGCGNGGSLKYIGERKPAEMWGMDISENQIEKAKQLLDKHSFTAKFICSPMEEECGIPTDYFDFVYSIYAIGWSTNLDITFSKIASYLKKDGVFIFSWSHPIHKCVAAENDEFVFKKCYFDESRYPLVLGEGTLMLADYKLSTYLNALAKAGFLIEKVIEESDENMLRKGSGVLARKAKIFPVTFVIKARKM
ncbi:MAG: methyltransferase domain-containing protein [Defluviitaleaceae bacterium]|nr:methyltransferase domain-containing protein [Defluviitaleaceae bacterium]